MIIITEKQKEYELLDSGNGMKLERYGNIILARPDPEAMWNKSSDSKIWDKADFIFKRNGLKTKWISKDNSLKEWEINFNEFKFLIKPTSFKHIGLFPEQDSNWEWMKNVINTNKNKKIKVLNLFAYTGGATIACASVGAEVCHVDASKVAVSWASENAKISGLSNAPIKWIIDDVMKFLKREIKRGNKYDAIIMDPPAFGHGPKDELWKIEDDFLDLINLCKNLLSDNPLFILINGYTAGYSSIVYENNLKDMMIGFSGSFESGELAIKESSSGKLLPCGIFARWSRN